MRNRRDPVTVIGDETRECQLALYAMALTILGGVGAFTPRILGQVLLVNVVTLLGLYGLHQLVSVVGAHTRRRSAQASPARFA